MRQQQQQQRGAAATAAKPPAHVGQISHRQSLAALLARRLPVGGDGGPGEEVWGSLEVYRNLTQARRQPHIFLQRAPGAAFRFPLFGLLLLRLRRVAAGASSGTSCCCCCCRRAGFVAVEVFPAAAKPARKCLLKCLYAHMASNLYKLACRSFVSFVLK